jgi:hypothetical protein
MEINIITAIIGGACTIAGAATTAVIRHWLEQRQSIYKSLPPRRREAISGRWVGKVYQAEGPYGPPIEFDMEFDLNTDGTKIEGEGLFEWEGKQITLEISGGYIDDYYLKLEYKDADYKVLRYGTFFFQISPDAQKLGGKFVGYAAEKGGLIYGDIEMLYKGGSKRSV